MEIVLVYVSLELGILVIASLDGDRKSVDPKLTPLWPDCGKTELLVFLVVVALLFFDFLDFGILDDLAFGILGAFVTFGVLNEFTFGNFDELFFFVLVFFCLLFLLFE